MSVYRIAANKFRTTQILKTESASPTVKTLEFYDHECSKANPGQFLMLWIPGVDEIPLSIMKVDAGLVSVAVKNVGEATKSLNQKRPGDIVGIRGPFGNSFSFHEGKVAIVGGGTGLAPLLFLSKEIVSKAEKLILVLGAKTKDELLFAGEFKDLTESKKSKMAKMVQSTEDGTCGITGLCTTPFEKILEKEKLDIVYACGPEKMILKVFQLAEKYKVWMEASLERLMRCGIGLCGSCVLCKYRVCRDGPVFDSRKLREAAQEFGIVKKDFSGRKTPV